MSTRRRYWMMKSEPDAFSIDDLARQEQLWQQLPEWNRSAEQLRRMLTRGEVESDRDGLAIFVTVPVYEAAGGPVRRRGCPGRPAETRSGDIAWPSPPNRAAIDMCAYYMRGRFANN